MGRQVATLSEFQGALDRSLAARYNKRRATDDLTWASEAKWALEAVKANDKLQECAPRSLASALLSGAAIGLSLNPVKKHAYLTCRSGLILFTPSYMGLEHLAKATDQIKVIQADVVRAGDTFRVFVGPDGMKSIEHEYGTEQRGEVSHAYCITVYRDGGRHVEVMDRTELDKAHAAAKAAQNGKEPPSWKFWRDEMYKKCVTRRAAKHWPDTERLASAYSAMDKAEPMDFNPTGVLISDKDIEGLKAHAKKAGLPPDQTIQSYCAAYGVESLTEVTVDEIPKIKRGITQRAKAKKGAN